jgi:hypothetical protein
MEETVKAERSTALILAAVAFLFCSVAVHSVEYYDHPQIGRYEGSSVFHQEGRDFDQYNLGLGPAVDGTVVETMTVRGKVLMTLYSGPEDASSFEITSAYRKLLESRGFEVLFACEKSECGEKFLGAFYDLAPFANDPGWNNSSPITQGNADFSYILVARSGSGERETYVSLIVSQGWWRYPVYKLDVVELQEQGGKISTVVGPGKEGGDAGRGSGEAAKPGPSGQVLHRKTKFGVQMDSDGYFGLVLSANRFEVCAKVQAVVYDGFPGDVWPDNGMLMVGGHAIYLFRPADMIDVGVGADARQGITLDGDIEYKQYLDVGLRVAFNYHLGEHFMVSGVLYPFWVFVKESTVDDSYQLTATIPTAAVAASFFF